MRSIQHQLLKTQRSRTASIHQEKPDMKIRQLAAGRRRISPRTDKIQDRSFCSDQQRRLIFADLEEVRIEAHWCADAERYTRWTGHAVVPGALLPVGD